MDLLLVTPSSRAEIYQNLSDEFAAIEPPVWSTLIADYIRRQGFEVGILDAEAEKLTYIQTADLIVKAKPKLTVFVVYGQQPSGSTQCMPGGRTVCRLVKESAPQLKTLVMGTHASALPERTLLEEPYDYVCQGEGPLTILGLLKGGAKPPGLWWREDGKARFTPMASKIGDLDHALSSQAWDLVDLSKYRAHNWHCFDHIDQRQPYASLQTSLGCPYHCSFCCINTPFGGSGIRYWSPENIIGQIDTLVTHHGVKNIKIPDEMFVLNENHVLGICDRIIERGYDLNIWAYARVDTVKEKFLEKLKRAGFNWLALGIESGSKHVRDGVEKGRFDDRKIEDVVQKIRASGIYVCANYIFGLPDDTLDSMKQTLATAKNLNTEWANFYSAMAYPGSPLYATALEKKWPLPTDWIGFSQHAYETLPLPTETLSGPEVLAFRDKAFQEYYSDPSYLAMIKGKFGAKVVEHIGRMVASPIKRKFQPLS